MVTPRCGVEVGVGLVALVTSFKGTVPNIL